MIYEDEDDWVPITDRPLPKVRGPEDVRGLVDEIDSMSHDMEKAHIFEDRLYQAVLNYYADGGRNPEVAIEALKSKEIRFPRYYA